MDILFLILIMVFFAATVAWPIAASVCGGVMTLFYSIGAVVSLLLFVYLVVALLKPELFS